MRGKRVDRKLIVRDILCNNDAIIDGVRICHGEASLCHDEHALRLLDHEGGICFSFVVHLIGEHEIEEFFINVHVDVPSHKKYDASRSMHRIKF